MVAGIQLVLASHEVGLVRADFCGAMAAVFKLAAVHGISIAALPIGGVWNRVQRGRELSPGTTVRRAGTFVGDADFRRQTDLRTAARSLVSLLPGNGDSRDRLDDGAANSFAATLAGVVSGRRLFLHSDYWILLFAADFERSGRMASDVALQPISAVCDYGNVSIRYRSPQCAVRILLN